MISILRRLTTSLPPIMEPPNSGGGSHRLLALANQLRLYKPPPPSSWDDDSEEQRIEETAGKVVSQVGFVESNTPIVKDPETFRPKRAAVLICLFEIFVSFSPKGRQDCPLTLVKFHCQVGKQRREIRMMETQQQEKP